MCKRKLTNDDYTNTLYQLYTFLEITFWTKKSKCRDIHVNRSIFCFQLWCLKPQKKLILYVLQKTMIPSPAGGFIIPLRTTRVLIPWFKAIGDNYDSSKTYKIIFSVSFTFVGWRYMRSMCCVHHTTDYVYITVKIVYYQKLLSRHCKFRNKFSVTLKSFIQ